MALFIAAMEKPTLAEQRAFLDAASASAPATAAAVLLTGHDRRGVPHSAGARTSFGNRK